MTEKGISKENCMAFAAFGRWRRQSKTTVVPNTVLRMIEGSRRCRGLQSASRGQKAPLGPIAKGVRRARAAVTADDSLQYGGFKNR